MLNFCLPTGFCFDPKYIEPNMAGIDYFLSCF